MVAVLGDRYRIDQDHEEEQTPATLLGLPIKTYFCSVTFTSQKVTVKAVPLPVEPRLQELAINILEQDIRLVRKANSITNGKGLLKMLDARVDEINNVLITVFEHYLDTLESLLAKKTSTGIFSRNSTRRSFLPNGFRNGSQVQSFQAMLLETTFHPISNLNQTRL
ncbi:MAG: hypothetical protein ACFFD4_34445 [Candidatus Odinarchaeota archaeon]